MLLRAVFAACVLLAGVTLSVAPASAQTCPSGANLREGTVKFFNESRGYGFIIPAAGGADIFVHHSELGEQKIKENDRVVFEVEDKGKGPVAVKVRLCGKP
jgi:CspA family cold shock protein